MIQKKFHHTEKIVFSVQVIRRSLREVTRETVRFIETGLAVNSRGEEEENGEGGGRGADKDLSQVV